MTNLDSILKSRDIPLLTKVHIVKAVVFPVVMYRCENWTTKKAEYQRTDAFKLWCWRRLKSPLDSKIKPVNPKGNQPWTLIRRIDAKAPMATWWVELTHWKRPWCWERLKAGEGDNRGLDGCIANSTDMSLSKLGDRVEQDLATEQS